MRTFAVVSDSSCDLPVQLTQKHEIDIVPFTISFDKTNRFTEGLDITNDEFYSRMALSDAMPKTYFPSVGDYVAVFKKHLETQRDVLCLCLSSGLSKSYYSALNAQKILSQTYPANKIMVIDSLAVSGGQGLYVLAAAKLRELVDAETAFAKIQELKKTARTIVTVTSLTQLARGGRMKSSEAVLGKMLKINPIFGVNNESGTLEVYAKVFGRQKALKYIENYVSKEINGRPDEYEFIIMHSRALEEAAAFAGRLKTEHGVTSALPPVEVGVTIGMHTGATVIAVAFIKKV